ncbi:AEC family transporter [Aeromicrobium phragmitis]|uniref:AEC family transporter n=1 Tax=Aeromicrobium phragmitis TaxID=2478914 RepID=UPI00140A3110|nr:AEC family transporter [Aeromicrobium phragmitis]
MGGAVEGFVVILSLGAVGYVLAVRGVLDETSQAVLSRLVYVVGTPALLISLLSETDVSRVFGPWFLVALGGVLATLVLYVPWALWRRRRTSHVIVGALSASYANAGYLGLPIAAYVLGDAAYALPTMMLQLVFYAPLALSMLEMAGRGRAGLNPFAFVRAGVRNPVSVAAVIGVTIALTEIQLPLVVAEPIRLLGQLAVPCALIAFGVSLRFGPRIGIGQGGEVAFVAALKLLWQPAIAYLVARFALGLPDTQVVGVTMMAALPTAQNVFVYASRFGRDHVLARDCVAVTTGLSLPVLIGLAALLG